MISCPMIEAVPEEGGSKVVSILMVVLLPAPLGPKSPNTCPLGTENEILFHSSKRIIIACQLIYNNCVVNLRFSHNPLNI